MDTWLETKVSILFRFVQKLLGVVWEQIFETNYVPFCTSIKMSLNSQEFLPSFLTSFCSYYMKLKGKKDESMGRVFKKLILVSLS